MSDAKSGVPWRRNWRIAVPVGTLVILASFGLVFTAPVVFPAILAWWLHIDLTRPDQPRPGWLGVVALTVYAIAASIVVVVVVSLDSHFACGGTLGGFGESASARLDNACVSSRGWRPVVGAVAMIALTIAAGVRIRRSSDDEAGDPGQGAASTRSGAPRAVTTMAGLTVFMVAVIAALVLT
jgi:hypothetical protein